MKVFWFKLALKVKYHKHWHCYEKYTHVKGFQNLFSMENSASVKHCSRKFYGWWDRNVSEFTRIWIWSWHWKESIHVQYTSARLKKIYTVGLTLRNNLQRLFQNIVHLLCTITGHHMHQILLVSVKTLVSPLLFNFMAWMLGFSDDPEDADYIELDDQTTSKIFLCVKIWSIFLIGGKYRHPSP